MFVFFGSTERIPVTVEGRKSFLRPGAGWVDPPFGTSSWTLHGSGEPGFAPTPEPKKTTVR